MADDIGIEHDESQFYSCLGVVELLRRNKGVAIVGPICTGKTQITKLVTLALRKAFNVFLRTSYISPNTFSSSELYGP